jgi:hypothetical protein
MTYKAGQGSAPGSFTAPDHEYPAYLELQLSATDSRGSPPPSAAASIREPSS